MNSSARAVVAVALAGLVVACGYSYQQGTYFPKTWKTDYVKVTGCNVTEHPAGGYYVVYVDPRGAEHFRARKFPFPEGTVFVKAQYEDAACSDLQLWTTMRKGPDGTAPETGNWQWQTIWERGEIAQSGQSKFCIECHDACGGEDTDWTCSEPEAL